MKLGVLIMAAGASSRFGSCKLLAELHGKPVIQHVIEQAEQLDAAEIAVISGRWHEALVEAQREEQIRGVPLLFNMQWERGLGGSIRFGVAQLADRCDVILILLADQVAVTHLDLLNLLALKESHQVVCSKYAGKRGVPAVFDRRCFDRLLALRGDQGAKALLYDPELSVAELEMAQAVIDVDRPEDLVRLSELEKAR